MDRNKARRIIAKNKPLPTPNADVQHRRNNGIWSFNSSIDRQLRVGKYHCADPGNGNAIVVEDKSKAFCEFKVGAADETRSLPSASSYAVGTEITGILRTSTGGTVSVQGSADGDLVLGSPDDLGIFLVSVGGDTKVWRTLYPTASPDDDSAFLIAANNLSDLTDASAARDNLGIGLGVGGVPPTTLGLGTAATLNFDTDGNLTANSDALLPTQRAVKSYVDGVNTFNLKFLDYINCSSNPDYPPAFKGDLYLASFAGRIGGASGKIVDVGDAFFATSDNAGGAEGSVGFAWTVLQHGDRYVTGSTGATDNAVLRADGTGGSTLQNSAATIGDDGTLTTASLLTGDITASGTVNCNYLALKDQEAGSYYSVAGLFNGELAFNVQVSLPILNSYIIAHDSFSQLTITGGNTATKLAIQQNAGGGGKVQELTASVNSGVWDVDSRAAGSGIPILPVRLKRLKSTTGSGTALLGTNCPAVTPTAPFGWVEVTLLDGSTCFIPAWK